MCECGCGELRALTKLRAPNGWYAIEFYPGCNNCGNLNCDLSVTFINDGDSDLEWLLGNVEEARFSKYGQWGMPVLDAHILRRAFAEYDEDPSGEGELSPTQFAFAEFISRGELRNVHFKTVHSPRKEHEADGEVATEEEGP